MFCTMLNSANPKGNGTLRASPAGALTAGQTAIRASIRSTPATSSPPPSKRHCHVVAASAGGFGPPFPSFVFAHTAMGPQPARDVKTAVCLTCARTTRWIQRDGPWDPTPRRSAAFHAKQNRFSSKAAPVPGGYLLDLIGMRLIDRVARAAVRVGLGRRSTALIETTGRRSGKSRVTPVTNGLDGNVFWIVTEHGHKANYVRNIEANPRVRVECRSRLADRHGSNRGR